MAGPPFHRVFYDDTCGFCDRQKALLQRLDWGRRFRWVGRSTPEAATLAAQLPPGALDDAIHCVHRHGQIHRGARCLRFMAIRIPLLVPFALLWYLPGALPLSELAYRWVSRRRHRLPGQACPTQRPGPPGARR